MRAIIVAAGMGTRLKEHTKEQPKPTIKVKGKTIIERQIDTYRACGITDITIVIGYLADVMKDILNDSDVKYIENKEYENTSNLWSLFCAEDDIAGEFIFSFGDIFFSPDVVRTCLDSDVDIGIVVDTDWLSRYEGRTQHPPSEADKVIVNGERAVRISKKMEAEEAEGEFIGMAKFSAKGAELWKTQYRKRKKELIGKPYGESFLFSKGHVMDLFQDLIDIGEIVTPIYIQEGWAEIDTPQDLEKANQLSWVEV